MTDLRKLIARRGQLKGQLTRFNTFMENFDTSNSEKIIELENRLQKIDSLWNVFDTVQSDIEFLDNSDSQSNEREEFEQTFFNLSTKAKKLMVRDLVVNNDASASNASINSNVISQIKLPTLKLPEFSGGYENWLQFHDAFDRLIHSNASLSNVQKFYYLQSCLKGEAAQVIHSVEISDGNYDVAWNLLAERYENKRVTINTHVKAIFDLPIIKYESHIQLRNLLDNFLKHLRSLKALGQPTETWDTLLIHIISNKFDTTTKREWEESTNSKEMPKLPDLETFLSNRCQLLETLHTSSIKQSQKYTPKANTNLVHVSVPNVACVFCKGPHFNYNCEQFAKLSIPDRQKEARKNRLCTNCLRPNHFSTDCNSGSCRKCNKKHHTLLHNDSYYNNTNNQITTHAQNQSNANSQTNSNTTSQDNSNNHSSADIHSNTNTRDAIHTKVTSDTQIVTHCIQPQLEHTVLCTANIYVLDAEGNPVKCRALLDCGSQSNFMTHSLFKQLRLQGSNIHLPISGIHQTQISVSKRTTATIKSTFNNYKTILSFLILDKITDHIPVVSFDTSELEIPTNLFLADPEFNKSKPIDILLGAGIFWELLAKERIRANENSLIFQKSRLGWLISGNTAQTCHVIQTHCNLSISNHELSEQLQTFWHVEEGPQEKIYTREQRECEEHFVKTYTRDDTGRFTVSLPLREDYCRLGDSMENAIKRFYALENRLIKNPELKSLYDDFMSEYVSLGHMTQIKNPLDIHNDVTSYYLPHHGVYKESSTTTKLRVVFDASSKTSTGYSLNDFLKIGPLLQDDLFSIVLRFRTHNFVIIGDICKMYRQINITDSERDLQRILYRFNPNSELMHFRLNTVTYGTASASFLAVRSLHELAYQNLSNYPNECQTILKDFYMDDLITGSDTLESTIQLKKQITNILDSGGFQLRKFMSNDTRILGELHPDNQTDYQISENENVKALGLSWNAKSDCLKYSLNLENSGQPITKRNILSMISKIFDPLGLIGPSVILGKIIIQKLWLLKSDWDDPVPDELARTWLEFYKHLSAINDIQIPRHVILPHYIRIELHGFSDASEAAYGACIFLRSITKNGQVHTSLLCAKSRVAPLKVLSIPRLELCGALLLAQLTKVVLSSLALPISQTFYWCDSYIVLAWLQAEPATWKTFVANRIATIQGLTDIRDWRYVNSAENPADLISRGVSPVQLKDSDIWWSGPEWLSQNNTQWPQFCSTNTSDIPDKRKTETILLITTYDQHIFDKFSSLSKMQRVLAYCLRFCNNCKPNFSKTHGYLTTNELEKSLLILIRIAQSHSFNLEIRNLQAKKSIPGNSQVLALNPFIDDNEILRVGGRLSKSELPYDKKYPILLPYKHPLTDMIIKQEHERLLHAGAQGVLASLRRKFWPINGRNAVRKIIHKCITCFRLRPTKVTPQMGDLPKARITPARPFATSGIDFAGPFLVKDGKTRNRKLVKCYVCIFICFATKASHLELVGDLSTESFLNAFKRFISRRGICSHVFTDNATNFVGASKEIAQILNSIANPNVNNDVIHWFTQNKIQWHFIPPRSPHFGGLWEASVKSAKFHMKRILGNASLTFEHLYTVLTQIEAVLNSRPLTPLSSDPQDLLALTPGHFLIGDQLTALPEHDLKHTEINRLSHYQRLQHMIQHFWRRWSCEYIANLQQRSKWKAKTSNAIKVGAMVILRDDNLPPLYWKLGRIIQTHPGEDSVVRVVTVKTANGVVKRAVSKVCVLPIDSD